MAAPPASATPARWPTPIVDAIEDNELVGRRGAVRQPQLRGPRACQRAGQLPGLAAAGGRLCAGWHDRHGHHHRAARHRQGRQAGLPERHLADAARRSPTPSQPCVIARACSAKRYGEVFKGPKQWQAIQRRADSDTYRWNDGSTYVQNPPYFEGITDGAEAGRRHHGRARPGGARRQHHHRPHLARPASIRKTIAGRRVPAGAPGPAGRLQQLRRAPRQPRGHDARHLRQHPHQERDGCRASKAA